MSAQLPPDDPARRDGQDNSASVAPRGEPDRLDEQEWSRLVVEAALDAVVMIDQQAVVTVWNSQAERTFGWSREEAVGRKLKELIIPPRLHGAHEAGMERYLRTGVGRVLGQRIEVPAVDRDGREFPIELAITAIRQGDRTTFSAFLRDISAPAREKRLLEMQSRLGESLRASTSLEEAATTVLQSLGEFMNWDCAALWMLDRRRSALRCSSYWEVEGLAADDFANQTRSMEFLAGEGLPGQALETTAPQWIDDVTRSERFFRADAARSAGLAAGVAVPIVVAGRAIGVVELYRRGVMILDQEILDALGSAVAGLGQFLARLSGIDALRRSEGRLRAVVENMLEGLAVVAPNGQIVTVNESFARIFGYEPAELVGKSAVILMPDRPEYRAPRRLAELFDASLNASTEHEGLRRSGELFPLRLQLYTVDTPDGEMTAAHVRDLSGEQAANRLKGHFVASVSHELRTPLTAVRGSLGLLLADQGDLLPGRTRPLVELAQRNVVQLTRLIDDLLDFERLERGGMDIASDVFPMERAVWQAVDSVAAIAADAAVGLSVEQGAALARGDEARIEQVVVNLLSNAVKFSPAGSTVNVAIALRDDLVEVAVSDAGPGVPLELRRLIFEPFRQAEERGARTRRGSGLGLAICSAIIQQHGGDLGVECPPEGGSRFWFRIPSGDRRKPAL